MRIIIGKIGSDAGYTVIDDTGIHRVGVYGFGDPTPSTTEMAKAATNSLTSSIPAELANQFKLDADQTVLVLV